jgi:hypothetical protein
MDAKYPRTLHLPFSPGITRDDKILPDAELCFAGRRLVFTEKLDGGNTMISREGVFARSHSEPARHPTFDHLKPLWAAIRHELGDRCLFGENLYAVHSIEYTRLPTWFFLFAVRENDTWLSWEDVRTIADRFGLATVPVLNADPPAITAKVVRALLAGGSTFGGPMEGIVVRNADAFPDSEFQRNVAKYVRAGHVQTDADHWTRHWRPANLISDDSP